MRARTTGARSTIAGALVAALLPSCACLAQGSSLQVTRRSDGVLMFSNNPARANVARRPPAAAPAEVVGRIQHWANRRGLDPALVEAVVRVESAFDARALSHKGAMGLMQLMPETARAFGVRDAYDPDQNLAGGTAYLRGLIDRFDGDLALALAGYNAGPEAVERHRGVPPYRETGEYVRRVMTLYRGSSSITIDGRAERIPIPASTRGAGAGS